MLLTRQEAAAALGMSLRHFQRHVQPYVRCVYSGQLRLYRPRDLERWADDEACRRGPGGVGATACRWRDTKTRFQGVFARHQEACRVNAGGEPKACNCTPSYYGVVWDRAARKHAQDAAVPRRDGGAQRAQGPGRRARARAGARRWPGRGSRTRASSSSRAAREGVALNKWGRRYRRRAWEDLESSLRRVPDELARRRLGDITPRRRAAPGRRHDARRRSGSRVRSVVNALRSLYRWAQDRELVGHDPAANVRLPAMDAKPRDRVATPAEFAQLLAALKLDDALPWALAGYGTARKQEIRVLDWRHVDLKLGAIELAADEEGRKPGGSWRVVPLVKPLRKLLARAVDRAGPAERGQGLPAAAAQPVRDARTSATSSVRVHREWRALGLEPIGLHESRHTAATWLDHAGVSPKVASTLMGHKTPEYQPGAASITLRRYTHTLPGELERARDLLDRFLVERTRAAKRARQ